MNFFFYGVDLIHRMIVGPHQPFDDEGAEHTVLPGVVEFRSSFDECYMALIGRDSGAIIEVPIDRV